MQPKYLVKVLLFSTTLALFMPTVWATETPLDQGASPPAQGGPTGEAKYTGPATVNYRLSGENFLIIQVDGLSLQQVQGFTWNGADISATIAQFRDEGTIDISERDNGFDMTVKLDINQLAGQNEFGLLYGGGNKLSAVVDSEKLTTEYNTAEDRGFGWMRVYGNVQEPSWCSWCWQNSSAATVHLWIWDDTYWLYLGATTTNGYGNYGVWVDGVCGDVYMEVYKGNWSKSNYVSVPSWYCGSSRTYIESKLYIQ